MCAAQFHLAVVMLERQGGELEQPRTAPKVD